MARKRRRRILILLRARIKRLLGVSGEHRHSVILLVVAGILMAIAGILTVSWGEYRDLSEQFRAGSEDRVSAVRRELEGYRVLLGLAQMRLAYHPDTGVGGLQPLVDAFLASRRFTVAVIWLPTGAEMPWHPDQWAVTTSGGRLHPRALTAESIAILRHELMTASTHLAPLATPPLFDRSGESYTSITAPVIDENGRVTGGVALLFRTSEVVRRSLTYLKDLGIVAELTDSAAPGRILYTHRPRIANPGPLIPIFHYRQNLDIGGRVWTFHHQAVSDFVISRLDWYPLAVLVAWLSTTLALIVTFAAILSRAGRVRLVLEYRARGLRQTNRRMKVAEERLGVAQAAAGMGFWEFASDGTRTATPTMLTLFGLSPDRDALDLEQVLALVHPEDRDRVVRGLHRRKPGAFQFNDEFRVQHSDGSCRWINVRGRVFRDEEGVPIRWIGAAIDVTDNKAAAAALAESQERFRTVFRGAAVGLVIADLEGRQMEVNDRWCAIAGHPPEALIGENLGRFIDPEDAPGLLQSLTRLIRHPHAGFVSECRIYTRDQRQVWVRFSASLLQEGGRPSGVVALCEDIKDRKQAEAQLEYQSLNDPLTGLPNRRLLNDRLAQALTHGRRRGEPVAVLCIHFDGFQHVNDSLGHTTGDSLMREVARRFQSALRESDTLARAGGDEFTVVAGGLRHAHDATTIASKLVATLGPAFTTDAGEVTLTANIGISASGPECADAPGLLRQAGAAVYAAKRMGKNMYAFYTPELGNQVRDRMTLENDLRRAIERGEIVAHYQPEFDARAERVVRFEALARWQHPTRGAIPPATFVPIAEECGLIVALGDSILQQACSRAAEWMRLHDEPVQVAVNVSIAEFLRDDFVDKVTAVLERTGLPASLLQLELTESVAIPGFEISVARMISLQSIGVTLSLDDFGTGYSSLSYLPRLPFDALKIDRSFVKDVATNGDARAMIQSLVALAHNLDMRVTVEGVETEEQLEAVRAIGCDEIQGYLLGVPCPDPESFLHAPAFMLAR